LPIYIRPYRCVSARKASKAYFGWALTLTRPAGELERSPRPPRHNKKVASRRGKGRGSERTGGERNSREEMGEGNSRVEKGRGKDWPSPI